MQCEDGQELYAGVIAYINHLFGMEEPPKGELSFSNANVTAVREGDIQKTPDITLNGDHRNKITIPVPQGVTGYNKSKGTNVSGGNLEVYGGDTFYLQAPLTVTGKWESGQLYGSVRESWKTLVLTSTGGNNQDIGAFISEKAAPVSFDIQWLNLARVKILKKDAETGNPLDGAVYGVYKNSTCTDQLLTIAMTGEDGISYSDYAIGVAEPVMVQVDTFGTGTVCADDCLAAAIPLVFGLTPKQIIDHFKLQRPIYSQTAVFGHFGRKEFPWERTDKVEALRSALL